MSELKRETLWNRNLLKNLIDVINKRTNDYLKECFPDGKPTWLGFFWRGSGTTGFRRAKKILQICEFFETDQDSEYFRLVFVYSLCTYKACESGLIIRYIGRSVISKLGILKANEHCIFDTTYLHLKKTSAGIENYIAEKYPDKFHDLERHAKNFQTLWDDKNISLDNKNFCELSQIIYSTGNRQEFKMTVLEKGEKKHRKVP